MSWGNRSILGIGEGAVNRGRSTRRPGDSPIPASRLDLCDPGLCYDPARARRAVARPEPSTTARSTMSRRSVHPRRSSSRLLGLAVVAISWLVALAGDPAEGREGLVELGKADPRLKGITRPGVQGPGRRRRAGDRRPGAMAFDDLGRPLRRRVAAGRPDVRDLGHPDPPRRRDDPGPAGPEVDDRRRQAAQGLRRRRRLRVEPRSSSKAARCRPASSPGRTACYLTCVGRLEKLERRGRRRQVRDPDRPGRRLRRDRPSRPRAA